jgi:hypothetical protein
MPGVYIRVDIIKFSYRNIDVFWNEYILQFLLKRQTAFFNLKNKSAAAAPRAAPWRLVRIAAAAPRRIRGG